MKKKAIVLIVPLVLFIPLSGIKEIGEYAFAQSVNLYVETDNSEDNVIVNKDAFEGSNRESLQFESVLLKYKIVTDTSVCVIYDKSYVDYITVKIPSTTEIEGKVYTVASICQNAFYNCINLKAIEIPSSVRSIENNAFNGCLYLKYCKIPNGVTHIGDGAFENCKRINNITIPLSVTYIGKNAFNIRNSNRMLRIDVDNKKNIIMCGDGAFAGCYVSYK